MKNLLLAALALALTFGTQANAEEKLSSGLKDGAFVGAFNVKDCTGKFKGTSLCYRCRFGGAPVVSVFARTVDENFVKLAKEIDKKVAADKNQQMKAFVVVLTDDPDAVEPKLVELAKKHEIKVPLTVFDGPAGPPSYKIQKEADTTVLMWNKSRVKSNDGFAKGKLDEKAITAVVKKADELN